NWEAYYQRARAAVAAGKWHDALADLDAARQRVPKERSIDVWAGERTHATIAQLSGQARAALGEGREAAADLDKALGAAGPPIPSPYSSPPFDLQMDRALVALQQGELGRYTTLRGEVLKLANDPNVAPSGTVTTGEYGERTFYFFGEARTLEDEARLTW